MRLKKYAIAMLIGCGLAAAGCAEKSDDPRDRMAGNWLLVGRNCSREGRECKEIKSEMIYKFLGVMKDRSNKSYGYSTILITGKMPFFYKFKDSTRFDMENAQGQKLGERELVLVNEREMVIYEKGKGADKYRRMQ